MTDEQKQAETQSYLDKMVKQTRESRGRKMQRHGKDFDNALAILDTAKSFKGLKPHTLGIIAAAALHRLAEMDDYLSVKYPELSDLDFEVDPTFDPKKPVDGD